MATVSFDKNIIIKEKEAVSKLVDALIDSTVRKIDKKLASPAEIARGEEKLKQYLLHCNSHIQVQVQKEP